MSLKIKSAGFGILGGAIAGFVVYNYKSKPVAACVLDNGVTLPDSTQTLWQAVQGAASHFGEDQALAAGGLFDLFVKYESLGLIDPTVSADIYSWWEGLTPDQQNAVQYVETNGGLDCVANETVNQVETASSTLIAALASGLAIYFGSQIIGFE